MINEEQFNQIKEGAMADDMLSQYKLAQCYANGEGCEKNDTQALFWFERSAEQGSLYGIMNAAEFYENGRGTPADLHKAAFYYEKAADESGNCNACLKLGMMYKNGTGVAKNKKKAKDYLNKAASKGSLLAAKELRKIWF